MFLFKWSDKTVLRAEKKQTLCFSFVAGFQYLSKYWRSYVLILAPFLLMPVAFAEDSSEEMRCAYVALLMAVYWVSEALPLPVTSLIPMVAFPFLGIMSTVSASPWFEFYKVLLCRV